ncbi:excalibur calcium-binding domain-containing protein [Streptomyces sp. NPDC060020]|uniref:excalibur calcium-binding domain-containing protein n=1 Tax=Streptomyces sp. NPDC060020 TaxID=3347038 RepID=UPI003697642A
MTYAPPYPHPQAPVRRWWQHPALIITLLVLIPPAGIALAWLSPWSQVKKVVATVLAGLWFLTPFLGDSPKKSETDAKPKAAAASSTAPAAAPSPSGPANYVGQNLKQAKSAAYAAGYDSVSHDAGPADAGQLDTDNWKICFQSTAAAPVGTRPTLDFGVVRNEWPCPAKDGDPIPHTKMPKVVGLTFTKASETLKPIGLKSVDPRSAYTDVTLPTAVDDWTVCFQDPGEGKEIQNPKATSAHLTVVAPATTCPAAEGGRLHPKPTPPSNDEDPGTSSSAGSSTGAGGGGSVYYKNCTAARSAGAAPVRRGDPGYGSHLDRDGDGVACE